MNNNKNQQLTSHSQPHFNLKCTRRPNCRCVMCARQLQIISMLEKRQQHEWFGRKKQYVPKSHGKQLQMNFLKVYRGNQNKNKRNQSQNFRQQRQMIQLHSQYLKNYNKKNTQKPQLYHPQNQLNITNQQHIINFPKTVYNDSFNQKNIVLQKQKPIKKLQMQMELPFIGKSSYKEQFLGHSQTQRQRIIKPKNLIKTIDVNTSRVNKNDLTPEKLKKSTQLFRPPSPFKDNGHIVKSNSFAYAYNTLYKNTIGSDQQGTEKVRSEPNPEFLMKSKYGSLGKTRWMIKPKEQHKKQQSLNLYL